MSKLSSFAAYDSTQTQKRALSFLKPNMNKTTEAPNVNMIKTGANFTFFKSPTPCEFKKPAELLHDLNLMKMRDEAQKRGNLTMFWGSSSGQWEGWLRDKGLLSGGDNNEQEKRANGWTDSNDDLSDISDYEEDEAWQLGGMKRPGEKDSEEFSSDEAMEDDWAATDSDDDDDRGGHMMPSAI